MAVSRDECSVEQRGRQLKGQDQNRRSYCRRPCHGWGSLRACRRDGDWGRCVLVKLPAVAQATSRRQQHAAVEQSDGACLIRPLNLQTIADTSASSAEN